MELNQDRECVDEWQAQRDEKDGVRGGQGWTAESAKAAAWGIAAALIFVFLMWLATMIGGCL